MWGSSRPARAKQVIFRVLSPGHRTSPLMWTRYERQVSVAQVARTPGAEQVLFQAVWVHTVAQDVSHHNTGSFIKTSFLLLLPEIS